MYDVFVRFTNFSKLVLDTFKRDIVLSNPLCSSEWSTARKMKFSIKGLSGKCDQIRRILRIWSHLLEESLMENFIFVQWWLRESSYS